MLATATSSDVEQIRLGDVLTIKHGWPFKTEFISEELTGRPIIVNIGNFKYTGGFRFDTTKVREYRGEYPRDYELQPGDILLIMTCQTSEGEILGIPARVPNDQRIYLHNQRLGKVVVTRPGKVDSDYLYWLFLWHKFNRWLFTSSSGTKILHTAPKRIESFQFRLPGLNEQHAIASTFNSLDNKIELNRQINKTLEAIGKAIFKHWFIGFEFPNEEGKPYKSSGGEMVYSEELKMEIPKGWRVTALGDLLDNVREPLKPGEGLRNRKYVPIDNLPMNTIGMDSYLPYTNAKSSLIAFEKDDILLGAMRAYFHRVCLAPFPGITRTTTFVLRPKNKSRLAYCLLFLSLDSTINYANAQSRGTTIPYAVWEGSLGNLMTLFPPQHILQKFDETLRPNLERIRDSLFLEIGLYRMRDLLLPKLMSGKIRVPVEA